MKFGPGQTLTRKTIILVGHVLSFSSYSSFFSKEHCNCLDMIRVSRSQQVNQMRYGNM